MGRYRIRQIAIMFSYPVFFYFGRKKMNFVKDDVKKLYRKFLASSMLTALATSIYSFVDTIAVGRSEGDLGAASMAVITPIYGVLIFLAIFIGVGGSVLMSNAKGRNEETEGNEYFTVAIVIMSVLCAIFWILFIVFPKQILTFFGANSELLPKAMEYTEWIIWFFPFFVMPTFISAFIRNDGAPVLTMVAVIIGGTINIFLDWFLVFPMKMGMRGAAIATVIGTVVQVLIMCSRFFDKKCRLKIAKPHRFFKKAKNILSVGIGASILDLGTVIIVIVMNNSIKQYGSNSELAVYGVLATLTSLFQALYCGVGQAIQPLVSANYGANETDRIRQIWKMSLATTIILGVLYTVLCELVPAQIVKVFVTATPAVIDAAPEIVRLYSIMFIALGVNVLSAYYLQSIMRDKASMLIAALRSIVVSGISILTLPLMLGIDGVWIALPVSEFSVAIFAIVYIYAVANKSKEVENIQR